MCCSQSLPESMMSKVAAKHLSRKPAAAGSITPPLQKLLTDIMESMMKMNKMKKILILIAMMMPLCAKAQWSFDVPSVEAYIADHKNQRSLLLARATLEQSNKLLHEYSSKTIVEYKELNFDLDKYTRAFDIIDLIYQSTRTAFNVKDTYNTVTDRIGGYKRMLDDFYEKCLSRGKIEVSDTLIISINVKCIRKIGDEAQDLYRSMTDLVLYATGAAACSTADLMAVMNAINNSLDNIRLHLNKAYFDTWRYIQVRIGYWKAEVYRNKSLRDIIDDAFGRWREASYMKEREQ